MVSVPKLNNRVYNDDEPVTTVFIVIQLQLVRAKCRAVKGFPYLDTIHSMDSVFLVDVYLSAKLLFFFLLLAKRERERVVSNY